MGHTNETVPPPRPAGRSANGILTAMLIAAFPVISVYTSNQLELKLSLIWAPLIGVMLIAAIVSAVAGLLMRSPESGAVLTCFGLLLFFTYDAVYEGLEWVEASIQAHVTFRVFSRVWAGLMLAMLGGLIVIRRSDPGRGGAWRIIYGGVGTGLVMLFGVMAITLAVQFNLLPGLSRWSTETRLILWGCFSIGALVAIGWRRSVHSALAGFLGRVAWILPLIPISTGTVQYLNTVRIADRSPTVTEEEQHSPVAVDEGAEDLPDIFHFVLDAYDRPDILEEFHGIEAAGVIRQFEERGFSVATQATANYPLTEYSFAATLNFEYLQDFPKTFGVAAGSRAAVSHQRAENRLLTLLKELGYSTYGFETGFYASDLRGIDHYLGDTGARAESFVATLLSLTPCPPLLGVIRGTESPEYTQHRNRIYSTFGEVPRLASKPSPKFVFVHVISPHQPHVLDENGEPFVRPGNRPLMTVPDGPEAFEEWKETYRKQVLGLNVLLFRALDELIPQLERPTVILVQGDHGATGATMNYRQKYGVLNAIRFAGERPESFTDDISLVNTYRVVLNEYFEGEYELLDNRSYWVKSDGDALDFKDVTDAVRGGNEGEAL